jgi:hypothetical protein
MERHHLARAQPLMGRALDLADTAGTAREQHAIGMAVALLAQASATLDQLARGEPAPYHTARVMARIRRQMILRLLDAMGTISQRAAAPHPPEHTVRRRIPPVAVGDRRYAHVAAAD